MISIRLLDNNLVELEFEDRLEYEMTRSELENRLGTGATKSITHGENNFSLNLRDFEYLLISENWLDDEYGITIEEEVMELLENSTEYHKELVEGGEEVWDAESILNHLTATYSTKRTPTDFQLENLEKMLMRPAAASFSVPGAGKTSEGLCYWLCNRSEDGKLLVVLPKVGFLAWEEEFREWIGWGPDKVIRLDISSADFDGKISANPDASVYLVTYARARNNEKNILDLMSEGEWSMILDESHNIKSLTGATSQSVRRIGNYARCCRLILTGTPAPQGEQDLHSQAEFLQNRRINSAECADWIRNIKVRTTKEQLKLKPTKTISHKEPLPKSHQAIYELLTNRLRRSIVDEENPDLAISEIRRHIMDIMRAASNPAILCKMPIFSNSLPKEMIADVLSTESWKITKTVDLVSSLLEQGKKVLVWSYFNENTDELEARLNHFSPQIIRGSTPSASYSESDELEANTREAILHDFKTKEHCRVIIANPAACGESISLHHWCHDAIYFDRSYNAGQFLQSCDRIHRYGKLPGTDITTCAEVDVTYHILISTGTIDEKIEESLDRKIARQEEILASDDFTLSSVENGTRHDDVSGMSDEDRENLLEHIMGR